MGEQRPASDLNRYHVGVQDEPNGSGSSLESSGTSAHVKERCYEKDDAVNAHYNAYLEE